MSRDCNKYLGVFGSVVGWGQTYCVFVKSLFCRDPRGIITITFLDSNRRKEPRFIHLPFRGNRRRRHCIWCRRRYPHWCRITLTPPPLPLPPATHHMLPTFVSASWTAPPRRVSIFDNLQYQLPEWRTFDVHVIIKSGNKIKQVDCLACKEEDCIRLNFVGEQSQSSTWFIAD